MSNFIDQQIDAFLRRHLFEMKTEREDDARAAVHAPEEHPDFLLRRLREAEVPHQQFPVKRVALTPERRSKDRSIRFVSRRHETLQMMARNQLVKNRRA